MVDGLAAFNKRFEAIPERVRLATIRAMEKGADELVDTMKRLAPVGKYPGGGALRDSIAWTWGKAPKGAVTITSMGSRKYGGLKITVYAGGTEKTARRQARSSGTRARDRYRSGYFDSDNARYQEFGTSKMRANPFFFPAYRALRRRIRSRITREISKAIRSA